MTDEEPAQGGIERFDFGARRGRPWGRPSRGELALRVLWAAARPLFALSPRHFYGWRRFLLRLFGAKVGAGASVYPSVRIHAPWRLEVGAEVSIGWDVVVYNLERITIGERSVISQHVHLCAGDHDFRQAHFPFRNRPIRIESDVWVCTRAFIGPGVTVGRLAVVGACAVVVKDVPAGKVVAGNPARVVSER